MNPRKDLFDYSLLNPIFTVCSVILQETPKRLKLYVDEEGKPVQQSDKGRICGLSNEGKKILHGKCLAQTLTVAQESWILLQVAKYHFGNFEPPELKGGPLYPVTPQQSSFTGGKVAGSTNTYVKRDRDFFCKVFCDIGEHRLQEKVEIEEPKDRFLYFDFPEAAAAVALEAAANMSDDAAEDVDDDGGDDDSLEARLQRVIKAEV